MGCAQSSLVVAPKGPKVTNLFDRFNLIQKAGDVAVYSGNSGKVQVLIIGAGAAGLGAANEAVKQGLSVKVIEARDRLGGRVNTVNLGQIPVDMGASWIHGIGPGCGESEEWENKENPIYTIAKENGIETVATWKDEDESKNNFYWFKGAEQELDTDLVDKLTDQIQEVIDQKVDGASVEMSFQDALENFQVSQDPDIQCIYKAVCNQSFSQNYAAEMYELSLKHHDDNDQFNGPEHIFPGGYSSIIDALANGIDISLNTPVKSINYQGETIIVTATNGSTFEADKVIVTVPLGVLQSNSIKFLPPLSQEKTDAIQRIGWGCMDKLWLEFPEAFWTDDLDADWINYISDKPGQWVQTLNLYKYLQVPVLLMFNIGDTAKEFGRLGDDAVLQSAMEAIRTWYPEAPDFVNFKRSNWSTDPYAKGAWAFMKAGGTPDDCEAYQESESTGNKVFFAGEATTSDMIGTVHGAYITGIKAAQAAANAINGGGEEEEEEQE